MEIATDIVYLIPVNKPFNSFRLLREIHEWGGMPAVLVIAPGSALRFGIGYAIGAVHFQRGYRGATQFCFRPPPVWPAGADAFLEQWL